MTSDRNGHERNDNNEHERNGNNGADRKSRDHDRLGRFARGNQAAVGVGRPYGSLDFMTVVREKSREEDLDFVSLMWTIVKRLAQDASDGNTMAAKLLLDRVFGTDKVNLALDATVSDITPRGPQLPHSPVELRKYLQDIVDLVEGPVIDVTPDNGDDDDGDGKE